MRWFLLALMLFANAMMFAFGQGWLGTAPADVGRDPVRLRQQVNAQAVSVMPASTTP